MKVKIIFIIFFWFYSIMLIDNKVLSIDDYKIKLENFLVNPDSINNNDKENYVVFYNTNLELEDSIYKKDYNNAKNIINDFLKKYKNIFIKINFVDDYMEYGYIAYFIYIKALLEYNENKLSNIELLYLYYYILDRFNFQVNNKILILKKQTLIDDARSNFDKYLTNIFKNEGVDDFIKEILDTNYYNNKFYFWPLEKRIKNSIYENIKNNKGERICYYPIWTGDYYERIISQVQERKDEYHLENIAILKPIEKALILNIFDKKTGEAFRKILKEKAKLNIKTVYDYYPKTNKIADLDKYPIGLVKDPYYVLYLTRNDKLGQKLLKKYIFDLK